MQVRVPYPCHLDAHDRDKYLGRIKSLLTARNMFLIDKKKRLEEMKSTNNLLNSIYRDYEKHYITILKEKQEQTEMLKTINKYLDDIIKEGGLSNEEIERTKREQENIIQNIRVLTQEIEDISKK